MLLDPTRPATVTILIARSAVLRNKLGKITIACSVAAAVGVFVMVMPWRIGRLASVPVLAVGALVFAIVGRVCNAIACGREAGWIAELGADRPEDVAAMEEAITDLRLRRRFL
jgi:drug/metabolite transporter (DMT)-like permease